MAIEKKLIDGETVLAVDTEEDFQKALKTGLPIEASRELGKLFGFPVDGEDVGELEDILPDDEGR